MDRNPEMVRPGTLEFGKEYLILKHQNGSKTAPARVKFAGYDTCPAFVIVTTETGKKWRCPRDELFTARPA